MAVLDRGSRRDNQLKSIYKYLRDQIIVPMGIPVYFMGMERRGEIPPVWINADVIPLGAIGQIRNMGETAYSVYVDNLLSLGCYAPTESALSNVSLYNLVTKVDNIQAKFEIGINIPVYDFDAIGDPQVALLEVGEKPTVRDVPTAPDLAVDHINIGVSLRHHAITIR
jgi:hypothetical protein